MIGERQHTEKQASLNGACQGVYNHPGRHSPLFLLHLPPSIYLSHNHFFIHTRILRLPKNKYKMYTLDYHMNFTDKIIATGDKRYVVEEQLNEVINPQLAQCHVLTLAYDMETSNPVMIKIRYE